MQTGFNVLLPGDDSAKLLQWGHQWNEKIVDWAWQSSFRPDPRWLFQISQLCLHDSGGMHSVCSTRCSTGGRPPSWNSTVGPLCQGSPVESCRSDLQWSPLTEESWCSRRTGTPGGTRHSLGELSWCRRCRLWRGGHIWYGAPPPGHQGTWPLYQI